MHFQRLTRMHLYSFLGAYVAFGGLTLFTVSRQSAGDWQRNWNAAATLGAVSEGDQDYAVDSAFNVPVGPKLAFRGNAYYQHETLYHL